MKKRPIIFLVSIGLFFAACENKSNEQLREAIQTDTMLQQPKELSNSEVNFIMETAKVNMREIQLGKLAQQKATSKEVKNFGQHMVTEHEQANEQLKRLAMEKNINLPDSASENMNKNESLSKLSGKDFDKKYLSEMVKSHKDNIEDFEEMAEKAEDPTIRSFAEQNLPSLRNHYTEAQRLDSMMNVSNKKKAGSKTSMK